jgi:hypothetical protein
VYPNGLENGFEFKWCATEFDPDGVSMSRIEVFNCADEPLWTPCKRVPTFHMASSPQAIEKGFPAGRDYLTKPWNWPI